MPQAVGDAEGTVNAADFGPFRNAFGTAVGNPLYLAFLDIDGDGLPELASVQEQNELCTLVWQRGRPGGGGWNGGPGGPGARNRMWVWVAGVAGLAGALIGSGAVVPMMLRSTRISS